CVDAADLRVLVGATTDTGLAVCNHASHERLVASLAETPVVLVVVDASDRVGRSTSPVIELLRRRYSTLPILAFCSASASGSDAVLQAARSGVSGLIFRGV